MVTRVYGKADGAEVIFYHETGDIWKVDVPWKSDGKYITEVFAEDEAGNVAYLCKMLFVISGHELQASVLPDEKKAALDPDKEKHPEYRIEIQKGGYEIECCICSPGNTL